MIVVTIVAGGLALCLLVFLFYTLFKSDKS